MSRCTPTAIAILLLTVSAVTRANIFDGITDVFNDAWDDVTGANFKEEYFLVDDNLLGLGHCGGNEVSDNGFIRSHHTQSTGFGNYADGVNCTLTIVADAGKRLLAYFVGDEIGLASTNASSCEDSVTLYDGQSTELARVCQDHDLRANDSARGYYETSDNVLRVQFVTDEAVNGGGFSLFYSVFRDPDVSEPVCDSLTEFHCPTDDRCIPEEFTCDSTEHCQDGSDEDSEYVSCSALQLGVNKLLGLGKWTFIAIVLSAGVVLIIIIVIIVICCKKMKKKKKNKVHHIKITPGE